MHSVTRGDSPVTILILEAPSILQETTPESIGSRELFTKFHGNSLRHYINTIERTFCKSDEISIVNLFSRKILCPKRLASLSSGSRLDANEISFLASMHNDRVTPTPRPDVFDHLFIITQLANPRRRRLLPIEAPFVVRSGLRPNPIMDSCYAKTPTTSNRAVHPSLIPHPSSTTSSSEQNVCVVSQSISPRMIIIAIASHYKLSATKPTFDIRITSAPSPVPSRPPYLVITL